MEWTSTDSQPRNSLLLLQKGFLGSTSHTSCCTFLPLSLHIVLLLIIVPIFASFQTSVGQVYRVDVSSKVEVVWADNSRTIVLPQVSNWSSLWCLRNRRWNVCFWPPIALAAPLQRGIGDRGDGLRLSGRNEQRSVDRGVGGRERQLGDRQRSDPRGRQLREQRRCHGYCDADPHAHWLHDIHHPTAGGQQSRGYQPHQRSLRRGGWSVYGESCFWWR